MRIPDLPDVVTVAEDVGCKLLDHPWTLKILVVLTALAVGFLIGVEAVRSVI